MRAKQERVWRCGLWWVVWGLVWVAGVAGQGPRKGVGVDVRDEQGQPQQTVQLYEGSYALLIGASNYGRTGWPQLAEVRDDLKAVREVLEQKHEFVVKEVLNPTRAQVLQEMEAFVTKYGLTANNRLLLYFAGHGYTEIDATDQRKFGYFVPVNAPLPGRDLAGFQATAVTMDEIENYAKRIRSKHALFLFDSCFSGTLINRAAPLAPRYITYLATQPVRQFITAGADNQEVPAESVFRQVLVEALNNERNAQGGRADTNQDGYLTGTELATYLQERVIYYRGEAQTPQYGKIRDPKLDKGDFVFVVPAPSVIAARPAPTVIAARPSPKPPQLGIAFVSVAAGEFIMGDNNSDQSDEKPAHRVKISEGFELGKYEVTQGQWEAMMGSTIAQQADKCSKQYNRTCQLSGAGPDYPMYYVSYEEVQEFIRILNGRQDGYVYRLPTEAEWEYAARAGTTGDYAGNVDDMGWYSGNAGGGTHPVGKKKPNAWGLYDMHGNVWEWCQDWRDANYYKDSPTVDPSGPGTGSNRVKRGGSWGSNAVYARSAYRNSDAPGSRNGNLGFRLARTPV